MNEGRDRCLSQTLPKISFHPGDTVELRWLLNIKNIAGYIDSITVYIRDIEEVDLVSLEESDMMVSVIQNVTLKLHSNLYANPDQTED